MTHSLYDKPLRVVAVWLALVATAQQLVLAWPTVLGDGYTGGFLSIGILCLAGISLLLTNHALGQPWVSLAGILCVVLAILWTQGVWAHGSPACAVWLGKAACTEQWLNLAVIALGLACLGSCVGGDRRWERLYTQPLRVAASLTYGWALLGAVVLFVILPVQATTATLPWLFLALALGLVPLLQLPASGRLGEVASGVAPTSCLPVGRARRTRLAARGLGMALLLTAGVVSALASGGWTAFDRFLFVIWAYALWGLGNLGLPRFNARWPHWAMASDAWPWFGLMLVGISLGLWGLGWQTHSWLEASGLGWYLTAMAFYLFLMLRHSAWTGFPWLAVLMLTGAGMAFNVAWLWPTSGAVSLRLPVLGVSLPLRFVMGAVGWFNVLLLGVCGWRRYGPGLSVRLGWQAHDLATPLMLWPSVGVLLGVLWLAAVEAGSILLPFAALSEVQPWLAAVLIGCALALSCFHVLGLQIGRLGEVSLPVGLMGRRMRRSWWYSHVLMVSLLCTLLAAWLETVGQAWHLALFLAVWSAVLLALEVGLEKQPWPAALLAGMRQPVWLWLGWSPLAAVVVWVLPPPVPLAESLVTFGIVGGVAACLGWQRQHRGWLLGAMAILVGQIHAWWLFWVPPYQIALLFPFYALQLAGLTGFGLWLRNRLRLALQRTPRRHLRHTPPRLGGADDQAPVRTIRLRLVCQALSWLLAPLAVLCLLVWTLHALDVFQHLIVARAPQWLLGSGEMGVAAFAPLLLIALGIRRAVYTQRARWVYGVAVLGAALGMYIRCLLIGLAPVQVWDTVALIGATYALFIIQRLTLSGPLLNVVLVLPLLALGTVPLQLASPHASGTLLTVGMLYLFTRRATAHAMPLYLGMMALNLGIYLWVPGWAHDYDMLQIYTIPASVSVLWLLHLHRHDVQPAVLHSARLAAISILYVSATLDVFLRAGFAIFVAVLVLSLAGVIIGMTLRTRAFLYAGVTFFVLNVVGQLILLFPEQRLGKAVLLLLLGTVITAAMIGFNAQREAVLQRLRIFRTDLATWT